MLPSSDVRSQPPNPAARPTGPLSGYRILELGIYVAAPACAGILADWGADVVKVEAPTGDPLRRIFEALGVASDSAPPFELDNRGKRSVVFDLRTPTGRRAMEGLLATADAFVTNLRPSALERLGLDHGNVLRRHPRLVYGSITGYGLQGPDRDRAAYDIGAFWARTGVGRTLTTDDELPPPSSSGFGDHLTAMALAGGVVASLLRRERTGQGGLVATSLVRTGVYSVGWEVGMRLRHGHATPPPPSRHHAPAPLVNSYRSSDQRGFWLLLLESDRHWPNLMSALDQPDIRHDPRFVDAPSRTANAPALIALLDATFATLPFAQLTARFDHHDVWWAPINSIDDLPDDEQIVASGAFVAAAARAGEVSHLMVRSPVDFDGVLAAPGPVPELGEHSAELLDELERDLA